MGEELVVCVGEYTVLNSWEKSRESPLLFLQTQRGRLVDELEDCIDCIVQQALQKHLISKDDYEDITYERGPRKQVRKLLDVIDCLGEESASNFCTLFIQVKSTKSKQETVKQTLTEYSNFIRKHKDVLLRRNDCLKYYNCRHGEKFYLSDHFVNLLLVRGHYSLEIKKNELLTFGQQRIHLQNRKEEKLDLKLSQLFQKLSDRRTPKKILVSGVAGIGKSVFVQKILYDFSTTTTYCNFDFALNFTFRDLNLINKPCTLREIILKKHGHLSRILDDIFNNSGKLLMILDGFDEFKFYNQLELEQYVFDPDEEAELPLLIGSLIKGELLPEATIVVTSRPTVINHIPVDCIERFVVITGFSVTEIEDYFQKFYGDNIIGSEIFELVRQNHFLFTLCYIPAFCWIVCSVLKGNTTLQLKQPKTMTDIYCHYLVVLLKHHTHPESRVTEDAVLKAIHGLGQLAYQSLLQHQTLFYEQDWENCQTLPSDIVNSFLDKTCVQELEYTENVLSFTHFTIQEFFAAFYYAHEVNLTKDIMDSKVQDTLGISSGYLDLFHRFLSGLLSDRNQNTLAKHLNLEGSKKYESYASWLIKSIIEHCEKGCYILNLLHCLFEQQRDSLASRITPCVLRLNMSDNIFSPIDFDVLTYFLSLVNMDIEEMDLTATHVNAQYLKQLQPYLHRCTRLWIGENNLDMEAIKVICSVLASPDCKIDELGLGWTQLGDAEFLELYQSLTCNCTLRGLWVEGNNISFNAIERFSDITSFNSSLKYAVLLGNRLQSENLIELNRKPHRSVIVAHIDDNFGQAFWQGWWDWIFQRCNICSDEKIVSFLTKVWRGLGLCNGKNTDWMSNWYIEVDKLLQERIKYCSVNNIKKRMEAVRQMFQQQSNSH
ncbi:NACHT, LRR and PYD domains-containing protein 3-like [Rhinophrynus dorsalis]